MAFDKEKFRKELENGGTVRVPERFRLEAIEIADAYWHKQFVDGLDKNARKPFKIEWI